MLQESDLYDLAGSTAEASPSSMKRQVAAVFWGRIEAVRNVVGVLGILMVLFGVLFTLQGVGKVQGSFMSNTTTWTVMGPIIALIGLGVAIAAWRRR